MRETPILQGDGVVLRPLRVDDAEALFAAHGDVRAHHFWSGPAHESIAQTARYIQDTLDIPGARVWAITETGGPAMGRIGLFEHREGVGEFGIIMRPDAQGRGLALKAVMLASAYAFETMGLHRLVADIDPDNSGSLNLFLRAGFHREALLKQNWRTHLGLRDTVLMAKFMS
ncbi:MAG: GNAT family N-acetyltransferase [Hyphomonadaceae bacterium]|nr:GNAT family N-acetyltransferase [Hyphomonadaceae bacterium]